MRKKWLAAAGLVIAAPIAAACGGTTTATHAAGTPTHASPGAAAAELKTAKIRGVAVLTNSSGHALYWFAPDTATVSKCTGACATAWPPVTGHAMAVAGATGHFGTIKRSNGTTQVTYNHRPLYTFTGDHAAGQDTGNGVNAFGGLWHVATVSGEMMPGHTATPHMSPTSGGGGY